MTARIGGRLVGLAAGTAVIAAANVALGRRLAADHRLRERETAQIHRLRAVSTPARDRLAKQLSTAADVPASVIHGVAATALLHRYCGQPRVVARPAIALVSETLVYLVSGALVGRERPAVPRLDHEQPTSSFPSGHLGATVSLAVTYAILAGRLSSPAARAGVRTAAIAWPSLLAWSRIYVGMHFPSDVLVGAANGVATGLLTAAVLADDRQDDAARIFPPAHLTHTRKPSRAGMRIGGKRSERGRAGL